MSEYSNAKPYCSTFGFRSISPSPLRVLALVGMATPTTPVTAAGRSRERVSGKSPKPLPKKNAGVQVLKLSASTRFVLVLWIQVYELFAQFDAEIRCNPFGDICCDRGLASLCCFDRRDGGKRQFIVH